MPANFRLDLESIVGADAVSSSVAWGGGVGTFAIRGDDFDSGTYTLEVSYDGGTNWQAVGSDTTLTAEGNGNFQLPAGVLLRVDCNGSAAIDVVVSILPHEQA